MLITWVATLLLIQMSSVSASTTASTTSIDNYINKKFLEEKITSDQIEKDFGIKLKPIMKHQNNDSLPTDDKSSKTDDGEYSGHMTALMWIYGVIMVVFLGVVWNINKKANYYKSQTNDEYQGGVS